MDNEKINDGLLVEYGFICFTLWYTNITMDNHHFYG